MTCWSGEMSEDEQQWWYGEPSQRANRRYTPFTALIKMTDDVCRDVHIAQHIKHKYNQFDSKHVARRPVGNKPASASDNAVPFSDDVMDFKNNYLSFVASMVSTTADQVNREDVDT